MHLRSYYLFSSMWTLIVEGQVCKSWGLWVFDCFLIGNLWEKHKLRLSSRLWDTAAAEFRFKDKAWNRRTQCKTNIYLPLCLDSVKHMGTSVCDFAFAELGFELLASLFLLFKRPCNSICVCFNFTLSIKSTVHDELEKWPLLIHRNFIVWCVTLSYFPPLQNYMPLLIKNTPRYLVSPPSPHLCRWGSGDAKAGWDQPRLNPGHSARWGDGVVMNRTVVSLRCWLCQDRACDHLHSVITLWGLRPETPLFAV